MTYQGFSNFEEYKESLPKESTDVNVEKEYIVGCANASDWQYIHGLLQENGSSESFVPSRSCDCVNDIIHSSVRGVYSLTDTEVEELRNHSKISYININTQKYPGTYLTDPTILEESENLEYRYSSNVKHMRSYSPPSSPGSDLKNRGGYSLLRHMQKDDPWYGSPSTTIFENRIQQRGTGEDVDMIVCDQDAWYGHIEFQNNLGGPQNYVGGNVLPGNGTCDVLDLVLDSPYYIDPDFFNADSANRLMTRWDGTTVPVESVARNWWGNNSTSYRSSKFVSTSNGGTATGDNDFGTISVNSSYTRAVSNGSNTAYQTGSGYHATPMMSCSYGRQYGWAYNANKWHINMYGTSNVGMENTFDIQKIFHKIKPLNSNKDNTRDPTVSMNSWAWRPLYLSTSGYYYHRQGTTGSGGVSYSSRPAFIANYYQSNWRCDMQPSSILTAGDELIDSGVIFVCSSGNSNQKLVKSNHPDFDNYLHSSDNTALSSTLFSAYGYTWIKTLNRPGFPGQVGATESGTARTYKTIQVGALDDTYATNTYAINVSNSGSSAYTLSGNDASGSISGNNITVNIEIEDTVTFSVSASGHPFWIKTAQTTGTGDAVSGVTNNGTQSGTVSWTPSAVGTYYYICQYHGSMVGTIIVSNTTAKERKALYSNMGNAVDCWAAARDQLTASDDNSGVRYNRYDSYYTINSVQSAESEDRLFGGTSCACPVAAGIIATKLQHQRSWTWSDVKTWIQGLGQVNSSEFHYGSEGITATDSNFNDGYSLHGNNGYLLWDKTTTTSGTQGVITLNISTDALTEGNETFRVRIREGSITGPIVGTSEDITISDPTPTSGGNNFIDAVRFASGDGLTFNGAGLKIYISPS